MSDEILYKMRDGVRIQMSDAEAAELKAEWVANAERLSKTYYLQQRLEGYGSVQDQLLMIYEDMKNGSANYINFIDNIHIQYPAPEEKV